MCCQGLYPTSMLPITQPNFSNCSRRVGKPGTAMGGGDDVLRIAVALGKMAHQLDRVIYGHDCPRPGRRENVLKVEKNGIQRLPCPSQIPSYGSWPQRIPCVLNERTNAGAASIRDRCVHARATQRFDHRPMPQQSSLEPARSGLCFFRQPGIESIRPGPVCTLPGQPDDSTGPPGYGCQQASRRSEETPCSSHLRRVENLACPRPFLSPCSIREAVSPDRGRI